MTHHSPVVNLLIQASEELPRAHVSALPASRIHLARNHGGWPVSPTDRDAAYWSSTGIIIKLDPAGSLTGIRWPDTGDTGTRALMFLDAAASEQIPEGMRGVSSEGSLYVYYVETRGLPAVVRMFKRAIQLAEIDEPEPRKVSAGSYGSNPRGASA